MIAWKCAQIISLSKPVLIPRFQGSQHVLLHSRRSFICHLQRCLQEDGWEFGMSFSGEPTPEVLMRLQILEFLLQQRYPADDQMQILQADPITSPGCLMQEPDSIIILPTSHGQLMEIHMWCVVCSIGLGIVVQLRGRIGARSCDEKGWQPIAGLLQAASRLCCRR